MISVLNIFIDTPAFSTLDGYAQVEEYAKRSREVGQHYLCVTDHGMMGAVPRQIRACEESIKEGHSLFPIYGIELYVQDKHTNDEVARKNMSPEQAKAHRKSFHLLAIAHNITGYKNLVQLSSWGWQHGYYIKPRVTHEQILKHKEGVTFSSCCYIGEIGQAFERGGPEAAEEMLVKYMGMFGKNFYLELMLLDFNKQKPYDEWLIKAHDKYKVPLVVTNDCFVERTQVVTQDGSKNIEDIVVGDKVLTHQGRFRKVLYTNKRVLDEKEDVFRVKTSIGSYAFEATGNHPVELSDGTWKKVSELQKGMRLKINKPDTKEVFAEKDLEYIELSNIIPECDSYLIGDSYVTFRGLDKRNTVVIPKKLPVTDDLLRVIGLYIAEGSVTAKSEVSFGTHVSEYKERMLLAKYFGQFGINVSDEDRNQNGKATRFSSVIWNPLLKFLCGKGAANKKLVSLNLSSRQMTILLKQYFKGDGSVSKNKCRNLVIPSTSIRLIEEVRNVLAAWGIPVARTARNHENAIHKNPNADTSNWNPLYVLNVSGKKLESLEHILEGKDSECQFDFSSKVKSIEKIKYDSFVYNIQVEEDETYTANGWSVHNCHYCNKEDSEFQRYMLMIQKQTTIADIEKKLQADDKAEIFELQDTNLWMKSEKEMNEKWLQMYSDVIPLELFEEAKRNTVRICEKAKGVEIDRESKLPQIPNEKEKFKDAIVAGMKWRGLYNSKKYWDRAYAEMELIMRKGFASYFLIQKMFTDEARRKCPEVLGWGTGHEAVGPGRGSGVGSLCNYVMGITDVDPLKHGLLFSRFLSEARGGKTIKTRFTSKPIPYVEEALLNL